ncbi:hypothetical protein [uncultured Stenotrophomonas sp.]|uniref:hypothetical protein n=1 Tax=uncultured Stenotrophomonas sp. TaxID=165438 RepID=UPI0025E0D9DA|nr:hypothetical protein [uncultured Stenotrophomonas sp.]
MKLRHLDLGTTRLAVQPRGAEPFRRTAHHVAKVFMALLPSIELNGSSKVMIGFGPRGDEALFDGALGVTSRCIEDFDFSRFDALDARGKEQALLDVVTSTLLSLPGADTAKGKIEAARVLTLESGFTSRMLVRKLSQRSASHAVRVHRVLGRAVGESWYCEVTDRSNGNRLEVAMGDVPGYLDRREFFASSRLDGDVFTVFSRLKRETFRYPLA